MGMRARKTKSGTALFALALLLFPATALAQVSVEVAPLDGNFERPIYLLEVRDYVLSAQNLSADAINGFEITVSVPRGLSLPVNSARRELRVFAFLSIAPGELARKQFQVRADSPPQNPAALLAQYSAGATLVSITTPVELAQSPISISARQGRAALSNGGAQSVIVTISNDSNYAARSLRAELIAGSDNFGNAPLELDVLAAHESEEREFAFRAPENPSAQIVLRVLFEDSLGRHALELPVAAPAAQGGGNIALIAIAAVVILVGYSIFSKKGDGISSEGHSASGHVDAHAQKKGHGGSGGHSEGEGHSGGHH